MALPRVQRGKQCREHPQILLTRHSSHIHHGRPPFAHPPMLPEKRRPPRRLEGLDVDAARPGRQSIGAPAVVEQPAPGILRGDHHGIAGAVDPAEVVAHRRRCQLGPAQHARIVGQVSMETADQAEPRACCQVARREPYRPGGGEVNEVDAVALECAREIPPRVARRSTSPGSHGIGTPQARSAR